MESRETNQREPLTLGSLFDGSGGFPLAGILAGVEPVWASEIEPFAIRVTTKRLSEMQHYGDVSALNGAEVEPVDIITFGSPCFPEGTLVLTDKGYLEIESIRPGMKVLTHQGRWRSCGLKNRSNRYPERESLWSRVHAQSSDLQRKDEKVLSPAWQRETGEYTIRQSGKRMDCGKRHGWQALGSTKQL